MKKKIGLLTGGGDCPGINAVIRAVAKTAINKYNIKIIGFVDGYEGLVKGKYVSLSYNDVSGILNRGGTIIGTSNKANPFKFLIKEKSRRIYKDCSNKVLSNYKKLKLDCLVCIGGDGTLIVASMLSKKGINIIGIPKTIDNDLNATDRTFGFDSAVAVATDAIDRLHSTAMSHHRVMIVEVMGRYAGWLALEAGIAGGGDIILIPEIPYDLKKVCNVVLERSVKGKRFSIIVVSEGAKPKGGKMIVKRVIKDSPDPIRLGGIANKLRDDIEKYTKLETRATILGHLQRGGSPTAFDRILSTRFGSEAIELVVKERFNCMVALKGDDIVSVSLKEAVSKLKLVDPGCELIEVARSVGTSFGD